MRTRRINFIACLLVAAIAVCMGFLYVPHHHHRGTIFITVQDHPDQEEEEAHSELTECSLLSNSATESARDLTPAAAVSPWIYMVTARPESSSYARGHEEPSTSYVRSYGVRTHKLRGSPYFS